MINRIIGDVTDTDDIGFLKSFWEFPFKRSDFELLLMTTSSALFIFHQQRHCHVLHPASRIFRELGFGLRRRHKRSTCRGMVFSCPPPSHKGVCEFATTLPCTPLGTLVKTSRRCPASSSLQRVQRCCFSRVSFPVTRQQGSVTLCTRG